MLDPNEVARGNEAMTLLHFAFRRVTERPDSILAQYGLGRVHHRILYFIGRHPGVHIGQPLATLGVTKQALNPPLRQLIHQGWVVSAVDPENRRARMLRLTERGAALEERLSGDQRERFLRVFREVGPKAEEAWRTIMRRLADP